MGNISYLRKQLAEDADRQARALAFLEHLTAAVRSGRVCGLFVMAYAESQEPDVEMDLYGHITVSTETNAFTLLGLAEAHLHNLKELSAAVLVDVGKQT